MPRRINIAHLLVVAAVPVLTVAACSSAASISAERELAAIAEQCRVPAAWLQLRSGTELRLVPGPEARYEQLDCVFVELRASDRFKDRIAIGFVGNEAFGRNP